ncbi:hypothetical protein ACHAXN_007691 [Cyclotella atomus]
MILLFLSLLQGHVDSFALPASIVSKQHLVAAPPSSVLPAFQQRNEDDYYIDDEDKDDEDPAEFTLSPEEFRYKLEQSQNANGDTTSMPRVVKSKPKSAPRLRQPIGSKRGSKDTTTTFACTNCNAQYLQWRGRCGTCQEWNTIEQFTTKKKSTFLSSDGAEGIRPKIKANAFQKGSSWLDGTDAYDTVGEGPVRLTDVYQDILPAADGTGNSWKDEYRKGSREERTQVPFDAEINAVLGGGIMPGSITLVGGDPGVGKSTLLLQVAGSLATLAERSVRSQGIGMGPPKSSENNIGADRQKQTGGPVVYVSGEENANQIASRALRLGIEDPELLLWCETDADIIADTVVNSMHENPSFLEEAENNNSEKPPLSRPPSLVIIDSIQTMICDAGGSSAAGGITQVRECVGLFLRLAKSTGVPVMLVGHVTKSGDVAGPRTVEHMVDCVLYLESGSEVAGDGGLSSLRILRAAKNRFGSSDEVGVYQMDSGQDGRLVPVSDPSSLFLATRQEGADVEGCAISVVLEGVRSMTVEVQALVSFSPGTGGYTGRRVVNGISNSRLLLILAVLQKRYGLSFHRQDVFVNVVGGLQLGQGSKNSGGSDLSVVMAIVSSLVGIPVRSDTAFVGEIGLLGELRPVQALEKRVNEARRMGFSRIVTPSSMKKTKGNTAQSPKEISAGGITQVMCENILEAINSGLVHPLQTAVKSSGRSVKRVQRYQKRSQDLYESLGLDGTAPILDDDEDDEFM